MKLTLNNEDTVCVKNGRVEVVFKGERYFFTKEDIEEVMMITTDKGPLYDDMCLAIRIDSETAIFVMSEHPQFRVFLFDELKTLVEVDHNEVINAAMCIENNIFSLYKRET